MPNNTKRLAVLVDADNVGAAWATAIFKEIATFGDATVRRIYGDFASSKLKGWREILQDHAAHRSHQPAYTKGKNSSDIALVIDAMDLLLPAGWTVSRWSRPTATSPAWRAASARRAWTSSASAKNKRRSRCARRANRFVFLENSASRKPQTTLRQERKPAPGTNPLGTPARSRRRERRNRHRKRYL